MRNDELVDAIRAAGRSGGKGAAGSALADDDDGGDPGRDVTQSEDTRYAQVISSPDDEPERDGRSLVTTNHDVIRRWAEGRDAIPATVPGTEHGDRLGVLRFDFPGYGGEVDLEHVSWDGWFDTFDERNLNVRSTINRGRGTTG